MEMRKTLLEKCEEVIDNTSWPFKSNNLKTGKIFNDLLQYHTMESGELSLEKMMAGFEEGTGLVKLCTRRLNEVEKRIEKLVKKDGEVVTEPFEADDEDAPAGDD